MWGGICYRAGAKTIEMRNPKGKSWVPDQYSPRKLLADIALSLNAGTQPYYEDDYEMKNSWLHEHVNRLSYDVSSWSSAAHDGLIRQAVTEDGLYFEPMDAERTLICCNPEFWEKPGRRGAVSTKVAADLLSRECERIQRKWVPLLVEPLALPEAWVAGKPLATPSL